MTIHDLLEEGKNRGDGSLEAEMGRFRSCMRLLSRLVTEANSGLDTPDVLQRIVDVACEVTGARRSALRVFDARGLVQYLAVHGVSPEDQERLRSLPLGEVNLACLDHVHVEPRLNTSQRNTQTFTIAEQCTRARAVLMVPVRSNDQIVGELSLSDRSSGAEFSEDDEDFLALLAALAAEAVSNSQAHASNGVYRTSRSDIVHQDRLTEESAALADIGRIISSSLHIDLIYDRFAERVRSLIPFDKLSINIIDHLQQTFLAAYTTGDPIAGWEKGNVWPLNGTATGEIIQSHSGIIVDMEHVAQSGRFPHALAILSTGLRTWMVVPVVFNDETIGTLHFHSRDPDAYTERDLALAESIAFQIAGAIANSQLHRAVHREAVEREALAEIGRIISSSLNIEEVYERFAAAVNRLIPFDRISIGVVDKEAKHTTLTYVAGVEMPGYQTGDSIPVPLAASKTAIWTEASHLFEEAPGTPAYQAGLRHAMAVPLKYDDRVIATMVIRSRRPGTYTERDLALAESIAFQIAGAIANSQLHHELRREAEEREALAEIGRIISSSLNIEEVYERFSQQVGKLISFDRVGIALANEEMGAISIAYVRGGYVPGRVDGTTTSLAGTITEEVVRKRSGMLVQGQDLNNVLFRCPGLMPEYLAGFNSFVSAPLIVNDKAIGALHLRTAQPNAYTDRDLSLCERIAAQIAGAIGNSRLYQELEAVDAALRESERRLQIAVRHSPMAIWNQDTSLRYTWVYNTMRGMPEQAILGKTDADMMSAKSAALVTEIKRRVLDTGVGERHEVYLEIDSNGRYHDLTVEPLFDESGAIEGLTCAALDITSTKQTEAAVRANEARFRLLAEATTAATFIYGEESFLYVNSRAEEITGYTREELLSMGFLDLIHPDFWDLVNRLWAARQRGEHRKARYEIKIVMKSGEERWLDLASAALEFEGFPAVLGTAVDITARKKAQEEAERERQRLQVLLDTSPVGIFVVDREENLLFANLEVNRIFGVSPGAFSTLSEYRTGVRYRHPNGSLYQPDRLPVYRALRKGERVWAEDMIYEMPDGRSVPVIVNATPVYSSNDEITGTILAIQDITALEEVERLRNEFLGIVSHELRTPLTAIKGSAATALSSRRPLDGGENRELFEIINEQADRLQDLVDNLLDMTRIEAGTLSISPEPVEVRSVLEEAQVIFHRNGGENEVVLSLPDSPPLAKCDRGRVVQVLMNLLSNAARFSPPTAPIRVELEAGQVHMTVRVQDQGQGLSGQEMAQLFRKFPRIQRGSLSGTGLGLAICKGIVEAHGGRIWAESEGEGRGATFSFTLPVAAPAPAAPTPREQVVRGRGGERPRVLAVDDEPRVLRLLQRSLDEGGFQPLLTTDPSQATSLVEMEEPSLVLLDLKLPGTSGFDLLERLREFSNIPIIFLTAVDDEKDMVRALNMGADDYITKPFSSSELMARIEAILRRRSLPEQAENRPLFTLHDLTIDFAQRRVTVGGREVSLSATEYRLLYELATRAGRLLTHDQILQKVWGSEYSGGETETIRTFIRNLRRHLGDDARHPRYIVTERGVGYMMPKPAN